MFKISITSPDLYVSITIYIHTCITISIDKYIVRLDLTKLF